MNQSTTNVALTALFLPAAWFGGWLFVLSGFYFMRTRRHISSRLLGYHSRYELRGWSQRYKKSDFEVTVNEGQRVWIFGRNQMIIGIALLIAFVAGSIWFWSAVPAAGLQVMVVAGVIIETPLILYWGTPGEPEQHQ